MTYRLLMSLLLSSLLAITSFAEVPDFGSYQDVKQKKAAFFDFMYPLILAENKKVLLERAIVEKGEPRAALKNICEKYSKNCDVIDDNKKRELLSRVDVIPPSLALAQSANESAWGTSRFARKGNNYFGQWCYSKGCGIVPARRNAGSNHEVRKFANAQGSVGGYIFNLNTGRAYADIRSQRQQQRSNAKQFTGFELATGLISYSERREEYVKEIQSMISYNKLVKKYDDKFWQQL